MPTPPLHLDPAAGPADDLADGFRAIRRGLQLPDGFPPAVETTARDAATRGPSDHTDRRDLQDIPFVTVDPPGSTDLDQALWIGRAPGGGFEVRYAIADVAAFVTAGDAVDVEARARGTAIYLPDGRVPLHPPVLSEHAASLRAGQDRPALVWQLRLDVDGELLDSHLERATVRSRAELDYAGVQRSIDDGTADEVLMLLREVGTAREECEHERGGVSLPLPDQQVVRTDGRFGLTYRAPLPVEGWNAQVSLLAGIAAARIMLDAGVGVLRTLPPPTDDTLATLRRHARALGVPWRDGERYADVVRSLDMGRSRDAAFATQAARLFRGAGYLAFDGTPPTGPEGEHAAVATHYAHVTAPLRRLVDRFANEVVVAHCAGADVPAWARDALPTMPKLMGAARGREGSADAMARDLVEASVLAGRIGDQLSAVVVDLDDRGAQLQVTEPAVLARMPADAIGSGHRVALGDAVSVVVHGADVAARTVDLRVA